MEIAGCQATRREPLTCSLRTNETRLNLWIAAREPPLVEVDGAAANARMRPSIGDTGWTVDLDVPRTANELSVRLGENGSRWTIALEATEPTPIVDDVEAELDRDRSSSETLRRGLARLEAESASMSSYERILAGRARLLIHRELGDVERAVAVGEESLELALERDRPGEAIEISQILVYLHGYRGDAAGVQLQLDLQSLYLPRVADAAQRTRWHYYQGVRAYSRGELRSALEELEAAEESARTLGLAADELAAASLRAPMLGLSGRSGELTELFDRILVLTIEAPVEERCRNANNLNNAGWAVLLARARTPGDDTAATLFERALASYGAPGGCSVGDNRDLIRNLQEARINYALEALMRSDWSAATARAAVLDEDALQPGQRNWLRYIRAELALQNGEAETAIAALHRIEKDVDVLLAWQAAVVEGRALEAMERPREALAAYLRAEQHLDTAVQRLGVDQGREGLVAGMTSSASHVIRLQLARGDVASAAVSARRSRTRAMRAVGSSTLVAALPAAERERWRSSLARYEELSAGLAAELTELWRMPQRERDQTLRLHADVRREMRTQLDRAYDALSTPSLSQPPLTRPQPGEVWLLYHPVGDDWFGFAMTADGDTFARLSAGVEGESIEQTTVRLLQPFASVIDASARVDVLAMRELEHVPFHVLPWGDAPLIARRSVAYRLDLAVPPRTSQHGSGRIALVVADPASRRSGVGRLPNAREEGELVHGILRSAKWNVTLLAGEQAIHADVLAAIVRADWLHYAGHGFSTSGWDSALPLAGEAELDVRSIVALPRVPETVVLSGCRTGSVNTVNDAGGQHLAAAFLLAGSSTVIATTADVDDLGAVAVARSLYESLGDDADVAGPDLLRRAVLRDSRRDGRVTYETWEHYRAWVP